MKKLVALILVVTEIFLPFVCRKILIHRCTRRGGGALGRKLISRAILLKSRAIFLFRFCFTNILNIFFSFVTCSMHKNPHQNAGNGIEETLFFKILPCPRKLLEALAPSARVGKICIRPPKISKPVRLCIDI